MGLEAAPAKHEVRVGPLARWPAVGAAALFIGGIALHPYLPHRPALWLVWLAALLVGAYWVRGAPRASTALLALSLVIAGLSAAQAEAYFYPRRHVSAFAADRPRLAQLDLRIDDPPRILGSRFQGRPLPPKQVTTATVLNVRTWRGWERASGQVLVQVTQPHPKLAVGQTARVLCLLQRPAPAMNPGQFDWAAYYRDQRILASIQIPEAGNIRILSDRGPGPWTWLQERTRRLLAAGFTTDHSLDHALLRALLLGDNDPELRDVQEQFRQTGTSHHLAISGMHIAVLGGLVWGACRLMRVRPRRAACAMLAFVLLYGLVALPSPPVVRSVLLCLAFGYGLLRGRALEPVQLLALSVLGMLVYAPLDLYSPGFQLSFGTVLGLILLTKRLEQVFRQRDPDERALRGLSKPTPAEALLDWLDRLLTTALAAGLVAWYVSAPLIAYHFGQLNPWAVVAGIVLAPVVFLALVGGLLKVLLTLLWPGLAGAWAWLAAQPVWWMRSIVDRLTTWPWGDVPVPPPALWAIALFYVLMTSGRFDCRRAGVRLCLRGGRVLAFPLLIFLPFRGGDVARQSPLSGEVRVTLLAVGAGQCAVIEPPSGRTVLVDAGSTSLSDLLAKCLGPFLRRGRYTSVDTVLVSHANTDHFSAVGELVAGYDVREVLTAPGFAHHAAGNPAAVQLLADLARAERPPREVAPGDRLPLGRDTALEVLWPPKSFAAPTANDASMVVRLTHAGRRILFTGDIQDAAMRELLKDPDRLKADVLIAPHHGSSEEPTDAFVRAVGASHILSSNDRTLTGKQRRFDEITSGTAVYRTHRFGAVTVTIDRDGALRVETFLDDRGRPRE